MTQLFSDLDPAQMNESYEAHKISYRFSQDFCAAIQKIYKDVFGENEVALVGSQDEDQLGSPNFLVRLLREPTEDLAVFKDSLSGEVWTFEIGNLAYLDPESILEETKRPFVIWTQSPASSEYGYPLETIVILKRDSKWFLKGFGVYTWDGKVRKDVGSY